MKDQPFRFVVKCAQCGRAKNQHRAVSLECPKGRRTPIGYVEFGPQRFTAQPDPARSPSQVSQLDG